MDRNQALKTHFGYDAFRGVQEPAIQHLESGEDALVLMPTGMGKSLIYQIPALTNAGLVLVVSPLIALMKDQVDHAKRHKIKAEALNSGMSAQKRQSILEMLERKELKLLYVTPERFRKPEFWKALKPNSIQLFAIDEAHCVSQWGHDFRPDFSRLGEIRHQLGDPTTLALTATATPRVQRDILEVLEIHDAKIFDAGVERENLGLSVVDLHGMDSKLDRFVEQLEVRPGATIGYFSLISTLEEFERGLKKRGVKTTRYHGRLPDGERRRNQEDFLNGDQEIILATPAFGLGVNKPNIRNVIHLEVPGSIEAYFQEVGRAGRDGKESEGLLFYDSDDLSIQMDFIKWANPDRGFYLSMFNFLRDYQAQVNQEGADFLRQKMNFYNSRDFRVETVLNLFDRWGVTDGSIEKRNLGVVEEIPDDYIREELLNARLINQQKNLLELVNLIKSEECRLAFIYNYFGKPTSQPCGKCDVCRG